jgi:hypothetical protein
VSGASFKDDHWDALKESDREMERESEREGYGRVRKLKRSWKM